MNPNTPQPNDQSQVPAPEAPEGVATPQVFSAAPAVPAETPTPEAANPVFGATPVADVPVKTPKNKKPLIIAAIIAGIVVIVGIAALLFFLFTTVSKQDYAAAAAQYNKVNTANSKLNSSISTLTSGAARDDDQTFNDNVKATETANTRLKAENDSLGKLKAVKVGEGGKLYGEFNTKLSAHITYATEVITSVKSVRPALVKCDAVSDAKDATSRVAALKACSAAYDEVGNLPNAEFKAYIDSIKVQYADYATTYESIAALSSPYGAQYSQYKTLRDKMYDIQDAISAASKDFSASQNKYEDGLSIKDSANALGDYLENQQK
jgi:hypothetical protein